MPGWMGTRLHAHAEGPPGSGQGQGHMGHGGGCHAPPHLQLRLPTLRLLVYMTQENKKNLYTELLTSFYEGYRISIKSSEIG